MEKLLGKTAFVNKDILVNTIDDEVVMMSLEKGKYYGLNEVGSRIWELIQEPIKLSDLVENLISEYDISKETCIADTCRFLQQLEKDHIIALK